MKCLMSILLIFFVAIKDADAQDSLKSRTVSVSNPKQEPRILEISVLKKLDVIYYPTFNQYRVCGSDTTKYPMKPEFKLRGSTHCTVLIEIRLAYFHFFKGDSLLLRNFTTERKYHAVILKAKDSNEKIYFPIDSLHKKYKISEYAITIDHKATRVVFF